MCRIMCHRHYNIYNPVEHTELSNFECLCPYIILSLSLFENTLIQVKNSGLRIQIPARDTRKVIVPGTPYAQPPKLNQILLRSPYSITIMGIKIYVKLDIRRCG